MHSNGFWFKISDLKIDLGQVLGVDHESELQIGRQWILRVLEGPNLGFQTILTKIEPVTVRLSYGSIKLVEVSYIEAKILAMPV